MNEKEFKKELKRRIEIIKSKYSNQINHASWSGISETILGIDELDDLIVYPIKEKFVKKREV